MRWRFELSPAIGIGLLGSCVSWWSASREDAAAEIAKIPGFSGAQPWESAVQRATARGVPVLVWALAEGPSRAGIRGALEAGPATDARLGAALENVEPVAVAAAGSTGPRDAGHPVDLRALGIRTLPAFVLAHPGPDGAVTLEPLSPTTGAFFEPRGLAADIERASAPAAALEPSEPDLRTLSRAAELSVLAAAPLPTSPPDGESELEKRLVVELDPDLLYRGWTNAASVLERRATAARTSGEYLGVSLARWERRVRETTRRAWIHCPDALVLPYGRLLLERYERSPKDLDSLDRAFMAAVKRTLAAH